MRMVVAALTTGVSTLVMRSTLTYAPCVSAQPLTVVRRARASQSQSQSHTAGLWLSAVLAAVVVVMVRGWCLRIHGSVMPSRG